MARWLASFSTFTGSVVVHDPPSVKRRRVRYEWRRSGTLGLLDVLAFRAWYRFAGYAGRDRRWLDDRLAAIRRTYPAPDAGIESCHVTSPNSGDAERFLRERRPDVVIALCKNILAPRIFEIPRAGTLVFHPGICPEYRNAHGCFWALARRDLTRVGMSVLRIDRGIDTGPVFGYFTADVDERTETHIVIQHRMTLDNLDAIRDLVRAIASGSASPVDVTGRESAAWGQPRLSAWRRWKSAAVSKASD
ncbi:MAG TPA: formyltransferase family protein [Gemmatimonadaceae bacterium]|nr:formyltransferase family protein [Gemmatimonadaceae bacterium]